MKSVFISLFAVASTVSAHYTFPELIVGSQQTGLWTYVRKTANYQSNGPSTSFLPTQNLTSFKAP